MHEFSMDIVVYLNQRLQVSGIKKNGTLKNSHKIKGVYT